MTLNGMDLLHLWKAGRVNGLSQRKLAQVLGVNFDSLHGKLYRAQQLLKVPEGALLNKTYEPVLFRSAVFDIEAGDLNANGVNHHLSCVSILPLDNGVVHSLHITFEDQRNDSRLLQEAVKALEEYDILIGHWITGFDTGWLASRLAYHGLPLPSHRWFIYDTCVAAKRMGLRVERKSLAFLCDFFGIEFTKTNIYPNAWSMIDSPSREEFDRALEEIVRHCEFDVQANRKLFNAIYPLDRTLSSLPVAKRL